MAALADAKESSGWLRKNWYDCFLAEPLLQVPTSPSENRELMSTEQRYSSSARLSWLAKCAYHFLQGHLDALVMLTRMRRGSATFLAFGEESRW